MAGARDRDLCRHSRPEAGRGFHHHSVPCAGRRLGVYRRL